MFTGIIENVGIITMIQSTTNGARLSVDVSRLATEPRAGDSLCVDGVCLTAVDPHDEQCTFDVIVETLRCTNLGSRVIGEAVNLERSMAADARFDGHFVQGHVDATGEVEHLEHGVNETILRINVSEQLYPLIVPKGSIAINGVSLTVVDSKPGTFGVALIPTTLDRTNLGALRAGQAVNLETDILMRALLHQCRQLLDTQAVPPDASGSTPLVSLLKEHGFA